MKNVLVILGSVTHQADRAAMSLAIGELEALPVAWCTSESALQYAMAAGLKADRLSNPEQFAGLNYDLALIASGDDMLAAALAEQRGAAMVFDVLDVQWSGDGVRVVRDLGRGARQLLRVQGPVVLGISDEAVSRLYISRYRRLAVGRRSAALAPSDPLPDNTTPSWQPARLRTRTTDLASKTAGSATDRALSIFGVSDEKKSIGGDHVIKADADVCAQHLLRFLAHHGFIEARHAVATSTVEKQSVAERTNDRKSAVPDRVFTGTQRISQRLGRGPRPLSGPVRGVARRPVPVADGSSIDCKGKLARRPRDVGQSVPRNVRGPYPAGS